MAAYQAAILFIVAVVPRLYFNRTKLRDENIQLHNPLYFFCLRQGNAFAAGIA